MCRHLKCAECDFLDTLLTSQYVLLSHATCNNINSEGLYLFLFSQQVPVRLIESVECKELFYIVIQCKDGKSLRYVEIGNNLKLIVYEHTFNLPHYHIEIADRRGSNSGITQFVARGTTFLNQHLMLARFIYKYSSSV